MKKLVILALLAVGGWFYHARQQPAPENESVPPPRVAASDAPAPILGIPLEIAVIIDGESSLVVERDGLHWEHRGHGSKPSFTASDRSKPLAPTPIVVNGSLWLPRWISNDVSAAEPSTKFPLGLQSISYRLQIVESRGGVALKEEAGRVVVSFSDPQNGDALYRVRLLPMPAKADEIANAAKAQRVIAPEGVLFLLRRLSIPTDSGVVAISPGTKVTLTEDKGERVRVTTGELEIEVPRSELTNDTEAARLLATWDAEARSAQAFLTAQQAAVYQKYEEMKQAASHAKWERDFDAIGQRNAPLQVPSGAPMWGSSDSLPTASGNMDAIRKMDEAARGVDWNAEARRRNAEAEARNIRDAQQAVNNREINNLHRQLNPNLSDEAYKRILGDISEREKLNRQLNR